MPVVVGTIKDAAGIPVEGGLVRFKLVASPEPLDARVVTGKEVVAETDENGAIMILLAPGDYHVWVPDSMRRTIAVPNTDDPQYLEVLLQLEPMA